MASQSHLAILHSNSPELQPPCFSSSKFSVGFSRSIAMAPHPPLQSLSSSSLAAKITCPRFWSFRKSSNGNVQSRRDVAVKSHLKLNLPLVSPQDQWGNWTVLFSIGAFGIW
ncbi:putative membrane protein YjcL-like [Cucumis melo var. makuwa]|nr:putative membrane protein YjcL-like [Cucumis melo var. makuwa]